MTFYEWLALVLLIYIAASVGGDLALEGFGAILGIAFALIIVASFALVIFALPLHGYLTVKLFAGLSRGNMALEVDHFVFAFH